MILDLGLDERRWRDDAGTSYRPIWISLLLNRGIDRVAKSRFVPHIGGKDSYVSLPGETGKNSLGGLQTCFVAGDNRYRAVEASEQRREGEADSAAATGDYCVWSSPRHLHGQLR